MTNQTEQGAVPPHIASTAPDHIWLDIGEQAHLIDPGDTFKTIAGGVTWSGDNATGCGVKYIRADLAVSIPEGCGWRPIDTAPKDGTPILLWEMYSEVPFVGRWETHGKWSANKEHVDAEGGWDGAIVVDRISQDWLTHWMPLPAAPTDATSRPTLKE